MKPVNTKHTTRVFKAPAGQEGEVADLPIIDREGTMVSLWRPTLPEAKAILDGKPVFLMIQGTEHPVVAVGVAHDLGPDDITG